MNKKLIRDRLLRQMQVKESLAKEGLNYEVSFVGETIEELEKVLENFKKKNDIMGKPSITIFYGLSSGKVLAQLSW